MNQRNIPRHVGIIMDGNGRWASLRNKKRTDGHVKGLEVAKTIAKSAVSLNIPYLSLYAFSTENWKRTAEEVQFLMGLLQKNLRKEFDFYKEQSIRIRHSGDIEALPSGVRKEILNAIEETKDFSKLTVNLAINYGGQDEIVRSVNKVIFNQKKQDITIESIQNNLDNPDIPPVDLIIRTAGEQRLSNFLLWESAYAEFYFSPKLWPDWEDADFKEAISDYSKRCRKFGGSSE